MRSAASWFGSRKTLGAASIPATAPSTAASPQPSAEHPRDADADEPRLGRVDRGGAHREPDLRELEEQPEHDDGREQDARSCRCPGARSRRRRSRSCRVGNGLSTARTSPDQINVTSPLITSSRPIVTITTRSTEPRSFGRITTWWIAEPADERERERDRERRPVRPAVVRRQRPGDVGRERRHLALGEVDDPGRAVDQHERERERAVDRRPRRARDDLLHEVGHPSSPGSSGGRTRSRAARRSTPRPRRARPRARTRSTAASSAIRASCSTTSTVSPSCSFSSRTMRKISRTTIGASPSDGSSSISSRGRAISARASASICCSPPESVPAGWLRALGDPREPLGHPLDVRLELAVAPRVARRAAGSRSTVSSVNVPRPSGTCAIPARRDGLRPAAERLARERDLARAPHRAGDRAQRRRLAGAVRAEHGDDLALGDLERDAAQRLHRPVARLDALELEQRVTASLSSGSRGRPRSRPGRPAPPRAGPPRSCGRS